MGKRAALRGVVRRKARGAGYFVRPVGSRDDWRVIMSGPKARAVAQRIGLRAGDHVLIFGAADTAKKEIRATDVAYFGRAR